MRSFEKMKTIVDMCKAYEAQYKELLYTKSEQSIENLAHATFNQIEDFTGEHSERTVRVRVYDSMQEFMNEVDQKRRA